MWELSIPPVAATASGLVYSGACILHGYLVGTNGVNDPEVTIYDNTAASGNEAIPTCTYDASLLGMNGATGLKVRCKNGLYLAITCAGAVEVTVFFTPYVH